MGRSVARPNCRCCPLVRSRRNEGASYDPPFKPTNRLSPDTTNSETFTESGTYVGSDSRQGFESAVSRLHEIRDSAITARTTPLLIRIMFAGRSDNSEPAAIHRNDGAGDVARFFRGEEHGHGGNLFRTREASEWDA